MKKPQTWREGRDENLYRKSQYIAWALLGGSVLCGGGYFLRGTWPWYLGCMVFVALPVLLDIVMPQHFTLLFGEEGKAREIIWPILVHLLFINLMPGSNWLDMTAFWKVFLICGGAVALILGLLAREFRGRWIALLLAFCLAGLTGTMMAGRINEVFDFSQPQCHVLTVESAQDQGGAYTICSMTLPDGREISLNVSGEEFAPLKEGDAICVELHEGALGIEYANAYPVE